MARFFFDFFDGELRRDNIGVECKDRRDVRSEAMRALPELARDRLPTSNDTQAYTVSVRNETNVTVYTATLSFAGVWLGDDIPLSEEPSD